MSANTMSLDELIEAGLLRNFFGAEDAPDADEVEETEEDSDASDEGAEDEKGKTFSAKYVQKLRRESAAYRVKATQLDEMLAEKATDAEKAEAAAEARGVRKVAVKLARVEVKAALKAAGADDPDDIIDDLNLEKFLDEDGEVDEEAVEALQAKWEKRLKPRRRSGSDLGAGRQNSEGSRRKSNAERFADNWED